MYLLLFVCLVIIKSVPTLVPTRLQESLLSIDFYETSVWTYSGQNGIPLLKVCLKLLFICYLNGGGGTLKAKTVLRALSKEL